MSKKIIKKTALQIVKDAKALKAGKAPKPERKKSGIPKGSKSTGVTFKTGNKFWQRRAKSGRDKIIATKEEFLSTALEYFEYTDSRTWDKVDWVAGGQRVTRKISPPYSRNGFCIFVGASPNWLKEFYKALQAKGDLDFLAVIDYVYAIIEAQQVEGATVGHFNANIISRLVGLVDKQETEVKGQIFRVGYKSPDEDNDQ